MPSASADPLWLDSRQSRSTSLLVAGCMSTIVLPSAGGSFFGELPPCQWPNTRLVVFQCKAQPAVRAKSNSGRGLVGPCPAVLHGTFGSVRVWP